MLLLSLLTIFVRMSERILLLTLLAEDQRRTMDTIESNTANSLMAAITSERRSPIDELRMDCFKRLT